MTSDGYTYAKPHSQAAWSKLPEAKRGFKSYQRYMNWWNSTVKPRFTVSSDPFAPTPIPAQRAMAQEQVSALINPLIKQFEESIARRSREGGRAIGAATDAFVKGVEPLAGDLGSVYDTSISGVKGVNDVLSQYIKDAGGMVSSELGKLIPEKDAGAARGAATTFGGGLSVGQMAQGASTLSRMYADRVADVGYAEKMPGYARGFGVEAVKDFERQLNLQRDQGLGEIRGQVPGLISQILNSIQDRELTKATARKGFEMDQQRLDAPATPDYSWMTGPSTQKWVVNPTTGERVANPNYVPPSKGGGKLSQTGLTQTRSAAQDLHDEMVALWTDPLTKLPVAKYDVNTAAGRRGRDDLLRRYREKVRAQVLANLATYYPNQPEAWHRQQATAILAATGWPAVAAQVAGIGPEPTTQAPSTSTPAGAAPTVQPKPRSGPKPPPAVTGESAQGKADTSPPAQQQANRQKREAEAYRLSLDLISQRVRSATTPMSRAEAKRVVITDLQQQLRAWPYKRIIAIANRVISAVYGNKLYP